MRGGGVVRDGGGQTIWLISTSVLMRRRLFAGFGKVITNRRLRL